MDTNIECVDVLILSQDDIFCRAVSLQASICGLSASRLDPKVEALNAKLYVADLNTFENKAYLDSLSNPVIIGIRYTQGENENSEQADDGYGFQENESDTGIESYCKFILNRPFSFEKLRRIMKELALSDISEQVQKSNSLPIIDRDALTVSYCGKVVSLSRNEMNILSVLMSNFGSAVTRKMLENAVGQASSNKVDVYICYLRRKLESISCNRIIRSVRGVGYMIG